MELSGEYFKQTFGIQIGTNCAPLHADLFHYEGDEAEFIQGLLKAGKIILAQKIQFHLHLRIYGVLSLNPSNISELIDLIYPCELEIIDTTKSNTSASYLDYYLCTDNESL